VRESWWAILGLNQ